MDIDASPSHALTRGFRLGSWTVLPDKGEISDGSSSEHLEPKVFDVLLCLAGRPGLLVTKQEIVDKVWQGRPVSDEVIARCISALRTRLGDDHKSPSYIETLPKRGYRLVAPVHPLTDPRSPPKGNARRLVLLAVIAVGLGLAVYSGVKDGREDAAGAPIRSIAVLPFDNLSDEADRYRYLADGVTEELTWMLSQIDELRVASRTSASQWRDSPTDVRDIGEVLGVDAIVEGSVRREGDDLRVTAQLVDCRTGFHVWSDTLDGKVSDAFQLQEQVGERVRESLGWKKSGSPALVSVPQDNTAYDLYLRGRYALSLRGIESLESAIGLFRRAVELDPSYGPAYLELARAYLLLPSYSGETDQRMFDAALETIDIGTRKDPLIATPANAVYGYIYNKQGRWQESDAAYRQALTVQPVPAATHQWYSSMLASVGRLAEAHEQAQISAELDPVSPVILSRYGMTSLWINDNPGAAERFDAASALGIRSPLQTESLLLLNLRLGRFDELRSLASAGAGTEQRLWIDLFLACYADGVDCDAAISSLAAEQSLSPRVRLVAAAILGELSIVDETARELELDIGAYETELLFIDELAEYRGTTAFARLVDSLGISDYWKDAGCELLEDRVVCL